MKKLLLLFFCYVFLGLCHAQSNKKSYTDFIVLNNNDTIYGKVLTGGGYTVKSRWVRMCPESSPKQRYKMLEVKAFRNKGRDYLRKEFIHIRWPLTAYLRVDIAGEISLLYMRCEQSRVNFDFFVMMPNGEAITLSAHNFYTKVLPVLKASPRFMERAGNEEIFYPRLNRHYYRNMAQLINWYNGY